MPVFIFCMGCLGVQPETQKKIDNLTAQLEQLDQMIANIKVRHDAGELPTSEAISALKPLLEQANTIRSELKTTFAEAEKEGSNKFGTGALIAFNILAVIAGRLLGIPGLASSSGNNILTAGRRMLSGSKE